MKPSTFAAALVLTTACRATPPVRYGYVARLGNDTVSVENVLRRGDHLTIDGVDRFPRVRRRHTEIDLAPNGGIRHLVTQIHTPSERKAWWDRTVEATVSAAGKVHLEKRDGTDTLRRDFSAPDTIVVAHVPQMYSLYDLYFAAAHHHVAHPKGDDTVHLRQFYIDREFDRFSMHNASVELLANDKARIWHDWLAGVGEATLDSTGHLVTYSGAGTTYLVDAARDSGGHDIDAIAAAFTTKENNTGGAHELSVRDTAVAVLGRDTVKVDYGRPLARGRVLLGDIVPYDMVWRTGANAATQLFLSAPTEIAGLELPAGAYSLWTVPRRDGRAELIVNKQSGQWGTSYDRNQNLGQVTLHVDTLKAPVEKFTISISGSGNRGELRLEWGTFRWTAPVRASLSQSR